MRFVLDNEHDEIQKCWLKNSFYEERELEEMAKYIKPQSVILDVGANIGNHAMWFDKNTDPLAVYVIEPHRRAISLMLQNAAVNYCHRIRFDFVGIALGEFTCKSAIKMEEAHNLGATQLEVSDDGSIDTHPGDDLKLKPDFIKIDVEGMELETLRGLKKTIKRCMPNMFVEVNTEHDEAFREMMDEYDYKIVFWSRNYSTSMNYIVCPNNL